MPFAGEWCKVWIYFGFVFAWTKGARPRFDTSTDMGLVLIPSDAEVDSVIFRLRATDQDADFPLVFEITATITPVVRIDNLPCTLYNKVCQANVILTKRLVPGRLHDFAVRVRDTKGDSNSMQATISVTNATTPRDKIFPHIPSLIMVPENTKSGKELDYLLVRANSWSGKPVYIELWQPKELFTIRQRQTPTQTRGVITLIGELDFETQSMYTLTMYATDPYTEPGKDTRNIAGLSVVVIVQDVQDVPPIFTLAPPLTRINNSVQPGDIIIRVHAEDGDKGVPREIVYGLVSEGNPFTPFFNISETSGEITLARPLEELTQITHVGAPVVLTVVAEEVRRSREEPPAQATVVDVGFLLGEPGNSPPYFESDNYVATIDENPEPGTLINFGEQYLTKVKDEDIGKAGVFALKLENNNGTFEINPTVAERNADFVISVRDNTLIDYELYQDLSFKIVAQEVGPATNLSAAVPVIIHLRDVNDNPPMFEEETYEVTLSENVTAGSRVVQVHATDRDTGAYGSIRYTNITGEGSEAFTMDPDTGLITVAIGSTLDREIAAKLVLSVEARDENGNGNRGVVPLIVNLLDVNDNAPLFEKDTYEFMLNGDLTNFTSPAIIKAIDGDAEPPNNVVRYELVHGNYENKFYLNETSGELTLRSPISKIRRKKQSVNDKYSETAAKKFVKAPENKLNVITHLNESETSVNGKNRINSMNLTRNIATQVVKRRRKRAEDNALYTLTARAYDLGVPHLSSVTKIRIISGATMEARIMMFVVPGEQPDSTKTAETLAAITGGRVTVLETRPYIQQNHTGSAGAFPGGGKKSIIVARVEQIEAGTSLVDVEKIREALAANGVGIIGGTDTIMNATHVNETIAPINATSRSTIHDDQTIITNNTFASVHNEEVTVYKAENKLLFWLLIILGLLMLLAIAVLIICCICPGCPFYMAPRKRRVHSSETLVVRSDGRPRRHLHRQPASIAEVSWNGRKQAWSADPTRRNWQFNKRNVKNCSLPGDVAYISGQPNNVHVYLNTDAQRLRDGPSYDHSRRSRMGEQDRMYMEDVEGQQGKGYDTAEMESLQQHEMERGSDLQRQAYRQRYMEPEIRDAPAVREQHFYRDGNAEVLRLVTRGQVEDTTTSHVHHHRPTTLIVDGKDIILQRFIEDQNSRQELSMQDVEAPRSMESHHRAKEAFQQPQPPEIILIPDRLELGHRQHIEEIGPNVQRLVIDHGDYDSQKMEKEMQMRDSLRQDKQEIAAGETSITERPTGVTGKEHVQTSNARYSLRDMELARQNALLTRLLLDRENRRAGGGGGMDSTSYLETQSLPGQVAIATQTDRSAATQTERQVRSRSDNDESDEESRHRKKLKSRKKHGDGDWRRSRTLWMKSPIEEEGSPRFDKRLSVLRKKVKEAKEDRQGPLEPEVLREISDSLDGNGSSNKGDDDETGRRCRKTAEQTIGIGYKRLSQKENGSQSSEETQKGKLRKGCEDTADDQKTNATESTSSPEVKVQRETRSHEKVAEKSPKKDGKSRVQRKSEGTIKPSLRILEKEFTILTKKLSKLGERKCRESTGSDSTSQEKSEGLSKDARKELLQKDSKKVVDGSSGQKQMVERTSNASKMEQKGKQKKETTLTKGRQKLKYQQTQVTSTGSSEFDDALDRPKKLPGPRQESVKQKGHSKLKRVGQGGGRREVKKQVHDLRDDDTEKRKDGASKEMSKVEVKQEKVEKGKTTTRAARLATLSRRDVVDEGSVEDEKDEARAFTLVDVERESNTEFSERQSSNGLQQRGTLEKKIAQGFSDDFVERTEGIETETIASRDDGQAAEDKIIKADESMEDIGCTKTGEGMSMKKVKDDSAYLKSGQRLITGRTISGEISAKDEKLTDDSKTPQDETIVNVMQTEKRSINTQEAEKHEDEDVKSVDIVESKENDEGKVQGNGQKDVGASETKNGTEKPVQEEKMGEKPAEDVKREIEGKSERKLQERKLADGESDSMHTQRKADKISKDVEIGSKPIDPFKVMRAVNKVEQMYIRIQGKRDVSNGTNDIEDKSDTVQEAESKFATEMFTGDSSHGKTDTGQTVEEFIQQDGKTETQSSDQSGITQDPIDKSKAHEIERTIYSENKQEDKRSVCPEESRMNLVVEEQEKQDTRETEVDVHEKPVDLDKVEILREQKAMSKVGMDDLGTKESVLPEEQKRYDEPQDEGEKCISQDQIPKNTVADENMEIIDKKQNAMESITTDQTTVREATSDQKIVEETIESTKADGESTESHKTAEQLSEGHQNVGEEIKNSESTEVLSERHKILQQQTAVHKIIEKPMNDQKVGEHSSKDIKVVEGANEDHKIDEKLTKDYKLVGEPIKDHEIPKKSTEESTEDHEIIEQPIEKHKVVEEPTEIRKRDERLIDSHTVAEEPTESPKIDKQSSEAHKIFEESTKDHEKPTEIPKVLEESSESHQISEQSTEKYKAIEEPAKRLASVEQPSEDHTVDQESTVGHNISERLVEEQKIIETSTDTNKDIAIEPDTQKIAVEETTNSKIPKEPRESYKVIEASTTNSKDITETIIPTAEEKINNEEKKNSADIGGDQMNRNGNTIFGTKEASRDEVALTKESTVGGEETSGEQIIVSDKEGEITDIANDDQNKKEVRTGVSPREESAIDQVSPDEGKVDAVVHFDGTKKGTVENNGAEEHAIERQDGTAEGRDETVAIEAQNSDMNVKENKTETPQEPDVDKINGESNFIVAQMSVDEHTSEKHTAPEASIADQQKLNTVEENTLQTILDEGSLTNEVPSMIPDINTEDFIQTEDSVPKMLETAKQATEESNVTTETDVSTNDNVKNKIIIATKAGQTSDRESISTSSGAEIQALERKSDDDKVIEKIMPFIAPDEKVKNVAKIPHPDEKFNLRTADESSTATKEDANIQEIKKAKNEEKFMCITDDNVSNVSIDMIEKNSESTVIEETKEEEEVKKDNEVSKHETERLISKKLNERTTEQQYITKELPEKALDTETEIILNDERIDAKLAGAAGRKEPELSSKESRSLQGSELLPPCPQMSETTEEEKFALDSIISETSIDSGKISGSEEQLMPAGEQTGLQELEQFVEEQTFCPVGDEIRPLPEERPHTEPDARLTASEESVEQDLTTVKLDETAHLMEDTAKEGKAEMAIPKQYADVSAPVFSSLIDAMDDSDDSDSSSDVSRKTTLTTGPYQTPRHHARELSRKEDIRTMESSDVQDIPDNMGEGFGILADKESLKEVKSIEHVDNAGVEQPLPGEHLDKVDNKENQFSEEQSANMQIHLVHQKLVAAADTISPPEEKQIKSKDDLEVDAKPSTIAKRPQDKKLGSETKYQDRMSGKNTSSSTAKVTKTDTFKVADRKMKDRVISQPKKKVSSEESSEEKATHPKDVTSHARYRTRKKPSVDQTRRKDSDQTKQSRKMEEESRQKRSLSKSRSEKDKKSSSGSEKHSSPPKTGEIDTSKAQPKYMAWYKKNREEMEKKRAEMIATDDEEQLPRWLRRSMKSQKSEKVDKKATSQKTAMDTTPRSRRKVKPLVNVESEQLKAIVRQGRMLRRAEGGQNEDPPVQIFATSPPVLPQADPKHRLMQHSEYKYEKMPGPFYLHPPPAPHPSPEMSPEHFDIRQTTEHGITVEDFDPGVAVSLQGGNRLRHQQLLEKKSVFDIAYSEAAPSQLRSDSTTPPS